jgi:L-rhamnonate dehydratase
MKTTDNLKVISIEWAELEGRRPRHAGSNARLGDHGFTVKLPIARITVEDGSRGWGFCRLDKESARQFLGKHLSDLFSMESGATAAGLPLDFPLWDLVGQMEKRPVYQLAAAMAGMSAADPFIVPCYDTSLYFDDLHLADTAQAADLLAAEAAEGFERGHRHFKIKVGRGARHLPLEEGTQRDIAIVHAIRQAVGPEARLMLDANNGYNLNLTKRVLAETAGCKIFWMEEAFHEDNLLYADLKEWMAAQQLSVLIADGEGQASPSLLEWAHMGMVDVIQYDIFSYGFTPWLALGRQLDGWGVRTAPHHYGRHLGNFVSAHLAAAIQGFTFVEWDEVETTGVESRAYRIDEGQVVVPNEPGFGLLLDEERFEEAVAQRGYALSLSMA